MLQYFSTPLPRTIALVYRISAKHLVSVDNVLAINQIISNSIGYIIYDVSECHPSLGGDFVRRGKSCKRTWKYFEVGWQTIRLTWKWSGAVLFAQLPRSGRKVRSQWFVKKQVKTVRQLSETGKPVYKHKSTSTGWCAFVFVYRLPSFRI